MGRTMMGGVIAESARSRSFHSIREIIVQDCASLLDRLSTPRVMRGEVRVRVKDMEAI